MKTKQLAGVCVCVCVFVVDVHKEYITEQDADDDSPTTTDSSLAPRAPVAITITSADDDATGGPAAAEDEMQAFRAPPTPPVSALVSYCASPSYTRINIK